MLTFTITDYTTHTTTTIPEPVGWDAIALRLKRDKTWHGFFDFVDDSFASLQFVGRGYEILRAAFDGYGIDAHVELTISYACTETGSTATLYQGRFVFARYKEVRSSYCYVEIGLETVSGIMAFRNRYEQKVDLDSLVAFDGAVLPPYAGLGTSTTIPPKEILLRSRAHVKSLTEIPFKLPTPMTSGTVSDHCTLLPLLYIDLDDLHDFNAGVGEVVAGAWNDTGAITGFGEVLHYNPDANYEDNYLHLDLQLHGEIHNSTGSKSTQLMLFVARGKTFDEARNSIAQHYTTNAYGETITTALFSTYAFHGGQQGLSAGATVPFSFYYSFNGVELQPGEKLYVFMDWYLYNRWDATADTVLRFFDTSYIHLWQYSHYKASPARIYYAQEALARTTESITNGELTVYSDYLGRTDSQPQPSPVDGCYGGTALTTGLHIRGIQLKDGTVPHTFVTMKQLYEGLSAIHNLGMGIEPDPNRAGANRLRIEPVREFYQPAVIHSCTYIAKLERENDASKYISTFATGYADWGAPGYNGLDDPFGTRQYRTTISGQNTALNKICELVASPYSIELTRRQYGRSESDWKLDSSLFMLQQARRADGSWQLDTAPVGQGNLSTTLGYNALLTPMRNAMRHLGSIFASYRDYLRGVLKFTAGEGNYVAATDASSQPYAPENGMVAENADLDYSLLKSPSDQYPLYSCELIKFEYPLRYSDWVAIAANPYGKIGYGTSDLLEYGWLEDLQYSPATGMAKWVIRRGV